MRARAFSLAVTVLAAASLVSASGAATMQRHTVTRIDVSTRAAVVHYLRSIHVNAKGAVIQRGAFNYAGTRCPGKTWTCASTRHTVVQIAKRGGQNRFVCRSSSCAVVQLAGVSHGVYIARRSLASTAASTKNKAVCIKSSGLGQSCTITQSGSTGNMAVVYEKAPKSSGLTQTASYKASITQTASASGANTACVDQEISLDGSTNQSGSKAKPISVGLQAAQSITITQDSPHGSNDASQSADSGGNCIGTRLTQAQTLTSSAGGSGSGSVTQNEDVGSGFNMSLDIEQNQNSGNTSSDSTTNNAVFTQTSDLEAVAYTPSASTVNQTQGSATSGITATLNQDSNGVSMADAKQVEIQCEDADVRATAPGACSTSTSADTLPSSLTQTQLGPGVFKGAGGTSSQTGGNTGDSFLINQSSTQTNDTGNGQTNTIQGDCHTSGNCTDTQTTNVNGTPNTNTSSGQNINMQTTCSGSDCSSTGTPTSGTLQLLPNGLSVSNTDVGEFGVGGMRGGDGSGSISVSGINTPIFHAFLYWNGPTNSNDPASNASVMFAGQPVAGTNIGTASSNCWPFANSQSYRADVTSLVTGNGPYSLGNFTKADADINGVALFVFYDDGNPANDRNIVLWNGNDSNVALGSDPANWDETISGVPYPGSGSASLDMVVGDGQSFDDGDLSVNGVVVGAGPAVFQGDTGPNYSGNPAGETGSLWDVKSFDIASLLSLGSNSLHITSPVATDCLSLVVAAANTPVSVSSAPIG